MGTAEDLEVEGCTIRPVQVWQLTKILSLFFVTHLKVKDHMFSFFDFNYCNHFILLLDGIICVQMTMFDHGSNLNFLLSCITS